MMSEIIEQVSNEIASQYDNQIEKALLKCGFTMQYCKEHPEEFLWIRDGINPLNGKLQWLGQHLFSITESLNYDDQHYLYAIEMNIEFGEGVTKHEDTRND